MGKIDVLCRGGILRAAEVVDLAAAAGLDLAAAATLLAIESHGGRNAWGSDGVSTAGIYVKDSDFTHQSNTANGIARIALVNIDRISIGDITVRNVQGMVLDRGKLKGTLLGMSFLSRLSRVDMRQGTLVLHD